MDNSGELLDNVSQKNIVIEKKKQKKQKSLSEAQKDAQTKGRDIWNIKR